MNNKGTKHDIKKTHLYLVNYYVNDWSINNDKYNDLSDDCPYNSSNIVYRYKKIVRIPPMDNLNYLLYFVYKQLDYKQGTKNNECQVQNTRCVYPGIDITNKYT